MREIFFILIKIYIGSNERHKELKRNACYLKKLKHFLDNFPNFMIVFFYYFANKLVST